MFSDLFTQEQLAALHVGTPMLSRNAESDGFTLSIQLKRSTDIQLFQNFPFNEEGVALTPDGRLEFSFVDEADAAFFLLKTGPVAE